MILLGKRTKYRERPDPVRVGQKIRKTPACYLPPQSYTTYRDPASMNTLISNKWAALFVKETASMRAQFKNIIVTLDGFEAHVSYRALKLLSDNNIVVVALPTHSSH